MPNANDIHELATDVGKTLDAQFKGRGKSVTDRLPKVRRKLPRKMAASLEKISAAEQRAKVFPHVSQKQLQDLKKEQKKIERYVGGVDKPAQRKQALRSWTSTLVFNLALFAAALTLWWYLANT